MTVKFRSRWLWMALLVLLPVGLVLFWILWPDPRMSAAKRDISKVEAFRNAHGRLPNSFTEIGITEDESGPVYYKKQDDDSYIVWYGLVLENPSSMILEPIDGPILKTFP
jgi:hypothetical protein